MIKFLDILKRDKIYAVFLLILIAVNIYSLADQMGSATVKGYVADEEALVPANEIFIPENRKMFDMEEVSARQARFEAMAGEKPLLYFFIAAVNLAILFFIFLGVMIDVIFAIKKRRGDKIDISLSRAEKPLWNVSDILRVVIVFVFFGYVFAFIQSFASSKFPVLGNINFRMISDTAFMNIAGVGVIFYFVLRKYSQSLAALGLSRVSVPRAFFTAIGAYAAITPIFVGIMVATFFLVRALNYEPPVQPIVEVFMEEKNIGVLWVSTLFAAIFGPIAEEIFFRGFMYPALKKKWGMAVSILVTSVIFSLLHTHIVGFLPIMALGILLAYIYEKTGSLLVPVAIHMIHNVGMVVMVLLVRVLET